MPPEETVTQEESTQQDETSTQTPPTPPVVTSPSISTDGRELYLSVLREKEERIRNLETQINTKKEEPKVITAEENQRFFTEPVSATRNLVRDEIQEALAPLMGFMNGFQKESAYNRLKSSIKQNPLLVNILTENESYVDQLMSGAEPTEANITAAIFQANGLKAAGLLGTPANTGPINNPPVPNGNPQPNNQPPINPASMTNPPHLRPSAPAAPRDTTKPHVKPLSENERRLMREWNMSEEDYRSGQEEGSLVMEPETTPKNNKKKES